MALQTSGAISLNQIHIEAGGSSGTICQINNGDIRGLIGKSSGATMSFNEWYGASNLLDTQTVTTGSASPTLYTPQTRGYEAAISLGSISDGTLNPVSNKTIILLAWKGVNTTGTSVWNRVYLAVSGSASNSGWTSMKVGSTTYTRTSATFSSTSTKTQWSWSTTSSPFGLTGSSVAVEFS
jgi:hypothetical protein